MRRRGRVLLAVTMAALLAAAVMAGQSGAASAASASAGCTPATNIEAIIDDSGSMAGTDFEKLRVQAMSVLIGTLPGTTQLGAVEFGSGFLEQPAADTIFPPEPVEPNASAMRAALVGLINADNGTTDYNGAFAKADADNPNAQARIFLTDGGHNEGEYKEAHLAHNVPTYVIGFGTGLTSEEDRARLQKIAADTGGQLFQLEDNSQLQPVMNKIGAAILCKAPPREFVDDIAQGKMAVHNTAIGAKDKSLQITSSWTSSSDRFKLIVLGVFSKGKKIAHARPKVTKLKVKRTNGQTFTIAKVSGLRKGTLRFAIKGVTVTSESKVKVTTQVGGSGR